MIQLLGNATLWSVLALCVVASQTAQADSIDDYIHNQMQKDHIPGISIAVMRDGKIVRAKGYGLANVELAVPATENTAYQLASVTKQFTATAIMMLVEEGRLSLDDPITALLPDLPATWDKISVHHLLTHTSGIKNYTSTPDFDKLARKDFAPRELLELITKEPLDFPPGDKWNYSNTGYVLLGMLIEKVTGKTYGEFLDERIFKPLGMTHTRVNDLRVVIPNRAQGYSWNGTALINGEYVSPTQPFAAGALISTVTDLAKWDAALYTTKLLKQSSLDQMWTPASLSTGETADYGFGWQVDKVNGHRQLAHGGGIPGFATRIARFVDDKLTVIVLMNGDSGDAGAVAQGIAGRVLPALSHKAAKPISDPDPQTTERLTRMIRDAMKGEPDPELFTPDMNQARAAHIKEEQARLNQFGSLQKLLLLERKQSAQDVFLRYRAVFTRETLLLLFRLDNAGKIAGAGVQPED